MFVAFLWIRLKQKLMVGIIECHLLFVQIWNPEVSSMAQLWADNCYWGHGQPNVSYAPYDPLGQNLYVVAGAAQVWKITNNMLLYILCISLVCKCQIPTLITHLCNNTNTIIMTINVFLLLIISSDSPSPAPPTTKKWNGQIHQIFAIAVNVILTLWCIHLTYNHLM